MSLVRVLEPEAMDTDEDARAYDSMDHAAANTALCDALLSHNPGLATALDVGAGTCLLPIALCRRAPPRGSRRSISPRRGSNSRAAMSSRPGSLRAALSLDEVREMLRSLRISPECAQVTSDRHRTLALRRAS
ncbi:hypothetical protein ACSRUE_08705 [Sorangium sp. KYC3313]|uniref:hypothetical protein n=1 Tax=Sorangium sp. KYC3313 TaxID=3449740 RepID=UPI003F8AFDE6